MTTETDPIETAALNHPDVQAGMQDAADGRVVSRERPNHADPREPFVATFERLDQLIAEGVKPRSAAIKRAAEETGVDSKEFRRHFQEISRAKNDAPAEKVERGARFAPKLDDQAREALRKLGVLNSVGLAPTVDEITQGATDYASQQASRWVVAQYDKATASMKKIEDQ